MATNSRREKILVAMKALLEELTSIKKVDRRQPTSPEDLRTIAGTQMPFIAMIGGIPQPVEHINSRMPGGVDVVISELKVKLFIYFMDNATADTTLSDILDDVWTKTYSDQTLGFRFVTKTIIDPNSDVAVWDPYVAFSLVVSIFYKHSVGGI